MSESIMLTTPEDGVKLMEDLISYCREYVRVGEDEYIVWAAWVLHCHAFFAFTRTPYLNVTSPTNGCGKTQFLEVTALVVPQPMMASSCTDAVLARCIDQDHPVLLVDEFDKTKDGDKDLLLAILKTLNSGYKKSGYRLILEPIKGGGWQKKQMATFCPKIIAGISSLPADTASRCIPIRMDRLAPSDHVSDPDEYVIEPAAAKLKARAAKWADENIDQLTTARPDSPEALHNRQREIARPLFAVADTLGTTWAELVRAAVARIFSGVNAAPAGDPGVDLLDSAREICEDQDKMSGQDLADALNAMENRQWAGWNKGKGITKNQVAAMLKKFNITTRQLWYPDTKKNNRGYHKTDFEDAWNRYLPPLGISETLDPLESNKDAGKTHFSETLETPPLALQKSEESPINMRALAPLALQKPGRGVDGAKANGKASPVCRAHPITTWWPRSPDGRLICQKCHPRPAPLEPWDTSTPDDYEAEERKAQEFS